jgi:16S rRNA (cytosine967-C5)-methyltransferase
VAPAALLQLASALLRGVWRFEVPADQVVAAFFRQRPELGARDRRALADTVYAALRQRLVLEHLARGGPGAPERRLAILAWQGDDRTRAAALQDDERDWLAQVRAAGAAEVPAALRHNLPGWLADRLTAQPGLDGLGALVAALDEPAPLDLRVNVLKARREAVQAGLRAAGIDSAPTPFSPWGLRVAGKPSLTRLPMYERGEIEVQDEGSQLLALLTGAGRGETVVDFCAGAGGKTLALGAMMRNTGRLYAFDPSAHRLDALKPRLARSGLTNVYAAAIAHDRDERVARLAGKADRVLVDAPCSGLGTLRRHPDLKWRQKVEDVAGLCERQRAILAAAAWLVRPGGRLVYATCSLLREENEAVADAFSQAQAATFEPLAAADVLQAARIAAPDAIGPGPCLRLWPHLHATDGFFAAIWVRR